ncbi:MAG TPA: hypothetical protein VGF88_06035 [Acidobacteriaceae bacterium]|jgi:hypothetical protein
MKKQWYEFCIVIALSAVSAGAQTNVFPTTGNVGVSTTTPNALLSLGTGINTIKFAAYDGGGNGMYGMGVNPTQLTFGAGISIAGTPQMVLTSAGNVGVNTTSPQVRLDLSGSVATDTLGTEDEFHITRLIQPGVSYPQVAAFQLGTYNTSGACCGPQTRLDIKLKAAATSTLTGDTNVMTLQSSGNVGIGTTNPGATFEVNGNVKLTANSGASITFADGTTQSTAYTGVSCGGDFAESVDVTGQRKKYEPGDLLVIDPEHPGEFQEAFQPYSTLVAGIYSTKPGYVGRRLTGPKSPDEVPLAMVGIVPVKVTTESGPIRTGDLLVASSTPGRAMKGADRSRLTGAVVGKALGDLDSGTGVIEVLVTLQ